MGIAQEKRDAMDKVYRERAELAAATVTLDGRPAVIRGTRNDYATVVELPNGPHYEWSWQTVRMIVNDRGGRFTSC
jgi:hypothetical protein